MSDTLGNIRGSIILDVKQALSAYTAVRQQHISTTTALSTGAGAIAGAGAAIAGAGVVMAGGLVAATMAAGEFERKLDYFTAVGGPNAVQFYDAVREKALQLGADTIYSADQIADSFVELAKAGVGAEDIINGIGEGVANLAAAADIGLEQAAIIMMSAVQTFGLGADEAVSVADKLAGAANASIVEVEDLGVSLKYAGGVASSLGISFDEVNAALALLGTYGLRGSTAGTSLRQILVSLGGATKKATKQLEELGIITKDGSNKFFDANGSAKSLADIFQILQDATKNLSDEQRLAALKTIFQNRALASAIALTQEGKDGFAAMYEEISKTTAMDVASNRLDNLSGDIEILRGNLDTLAIDSGGAFQSFARTLVQGVTSMIQSFMDLDPQVQRFILWGTAIASAVSVIVGGFMLFAGWALNLVANLIRIADAMGGFANLAKAVFKPWFLLFGLLRAHPFGLLITAIVAIVGALVYFFSQTEQGQAIWGQFMGILQNLMSTVGPVIVSFLTSMGDTLGGVLASGLQLVTPLLELVGSILQTIIAPLLPIITQLLDGMAAAWAGVGSSTDGFAGFVELFSSITAGIINSIPVIITAVVQLVTLILQALVAALPLLVTAGLKLFTGLIQAMTQVLPQIITALTQVITQVLTALVSAVPMLLTAAIQLFTGIVQALPTVLPQILTAVLDAILQIISALIGALPVLLNGALTLFMGIVQAIPQIIPPLIEALVMLIPTLLGTIVSMIPMLLDAAIELFMAIIDAIPEIIPPLIEGIVGLIPTLIETVVSLIPQLLQAAIDLFLALVDALPRIIPALIDAIIGLIPTIIDTVISLVPQLLDAAYQLFLAIVDAVPKIWNSLSNAIGTLGRQIMEGLAAGIQNAGQAVMNAIGGVIDGAIGWAKDLLGIASPSKVFKAIGEFVGQGFAKGIRGTISQVTKAADDMIKKLKAAMNAGDISRKTGRNLIDNIKSTTSKIRAAVKEREKVLDQLKDAQANLEDLVKERADYIRNVRDQVQGLADVSEFKSATKMRQHLRNVRDDLKKFRVTMKKLQKLGVDDVTAQQLMDQFLQTGDASAANALLAGGASAVKDIANLRKQIDREAKALGISLADQYYAAGIDAARGFRDGLKKEAKKLDEIADNLAKRLVTTIKKQLGIKSPSKVLAKLGTYAIQGLANGIHRMIPTVGREMTKVNDELTNFYSQVGAAAELENQLAIAGTVTVDSDMTQVVALLQKLDAKLDAIAMRETFHIENLEVNSKDEERPVDEALPDAIRKMAEMLG